MPGKTTLSILAGRHSNATDICSCRMPARIGFRPLSGGKNHGIFSSSASYACTAIGFLLPGKSQSDIIEKNEGMVSGLQLVGDQGERLYSVQ